MNILKLALARASKWPQRLLGAARSGAAEPVITALSFAPEPALVRVRRLAPAEGQAAGEWRLLAARRAEAGEPPLAALKRWRREGLLPSSGAVLVLGGADRFLQVLDRPPVPDAEVSLAVRWPLAESMEAEPEDLLVTAIDLKPVNDSGRQQVLAVATRTAAVRTQLALLEEAGAKVKHIDVAESALRGLALLHARPESGTIVLLSMGRELAVGLLWQGELCALRSLPLPAVQDRQAIAWVDQLALQVQRTSDHFERQATQLAVREVLTCLPGFSEAERAALCSAVALPTREVRPQPAPPAAAAAAAAVAADGAAPGQAAEAAGAAEDADALSALVFVAVVRLTAQQALLAAKAPLAKAAGPIEPKLVNAAEATNPAATPAGLAQPGARARSSPAEAAAQALALAAAPAADPARAKLDAKTSSTAPMEWTP